MHWRRAKHHDYVGFWGAIPLSVGSHGPMQPAGFLLGSVFLYITYISSFLCAPSQAEPVNGGIRQRIRTCKGCIFSCRGCTHGSVSTRENCSGLYFQKVISGTSGKTRFLDSDMKHRAQTHYQAGRNPDSAPYSALRFPALEIPPEGSCNQQMHANGRSWDSRKRANSLRSPSSAPFSLFHAP